ncbi:glycosyltransferase 87 family protein [Actinomadura sp. 21ATH]|uniref:glycosyltransferase 87 family protein n=1 Tax=Actinomadura sp. 21ATH TaxID=1735444 RepID=UPI0035C17655
MGAAPGGWSGVLLGAVVFTVALAALIRFVLGYRERLWTMQDLDVYLAAGRLVRSSGDVYGWVSPEGLPFTYPPAAAVFFVWTSFLPAEAMRWISALAGLAALLAICWITWGMLGYGRDRQRLGATLMVAGAALWTEPVLRNLFYGQVNLLIVVLVMADMARPDDRRSKGVLIGLAAGVKVVPGVFIAYLLLTRRFRAAAVAAGSFAATVLAGAVVLPGDTARFWFHDLFGNSARLEPEFAPNQSLGGMLIRLAGDPSAARPYWWVAVVLVGAAGFALAVVAGRRGDDILGMLTCAFTALLVSPIAWSHHWVWIVPVLVIAVFHFRPGAGAARLLALPLLYLPFSGGLDLIWRVPLDHRREYAWNGVQFAIGNLYVWIGLVLLLAVAVRTFRTRAELGAGNGPAGS